MNPVVPAEHERAASAGAELRLLALPGIALVTEGDAEIAKRVDHAVPVPATNQLLMPILMSVPLQLLAYHIAVLRGADVDQPRNLAKSVTVE